MLFYAFWPNFQNFKSNLGCFSVLFLVRLGEFLGVIFYWKNVHLKDTCTVLCSLLLFTESFQFSLTHHLPQKIFWCIWCIGSLFIIYQLWLTSHPRSTVVLPWTVEPGGGGGRFCQFFQNLPFLPQILAFLCLQPPHVPVSSRTFKFTPPSMSTRQRNSWWWCPRGGGYFGLRSYGDVPTFRVDFLTQNILDMVQIWVSTKC